MSMPAIERVIPLVGQLPAAIRESLARRLRELAGLGLLTLSGGVAASLMTWSVQDPSLSHATSRAIRNIIGYPGAIFADLLMQILGNRYGYVRPAGGFCVWLDVRDRGGDEAAAVKLYRDGGVRVVPGSYLARQQSDGSNPGAGYIRLALVADSETTAEALHRLVEILQ